VNSLRVTYNSSQIDKGYVPFFDAKSLGVRNIATPLPGFTAVHRVRRVLARADRCQAERDSHHVVSDSSTT
jgi:hypothetical protein